MGVSTDFIPPGVDPTVWLTIWKMWLNTILCISGCKSVKWKLDDAEKESTSLWFENSWVERVELYTEANLLEILAAQNERSLSL